MVSYYVEGPKVFADVLMDDWFKRTFEEYGEAKRLMQLFLEAIIPERKIVSLSYAPQESTNQNPGKKGVRVDVECYDQNGQRFVVEVQRATQNSFYDRAVFNSTFAIQRQIDTGQKSYRFPPVYFIGIMRFSLHKDDGRFLYRYSLTEDTSGEKMTDNLHYIFLEIPKCGCGKDATLIEKVGYALKNLRLMDKRPEGFDGEFFDLLFSSAEICNFTPEEKIKYENDMNSERDTQNQIEYAHDEGFKQGKKQGIEQGKKQGLAQGMEQGAHQEKISIAKALLKQGVDTAIILQSTGLTPEELAAL